MATAAFSTSAGYRDLRRMVLGQEMVLFIAIVLLFVVVGLINPRFVAERNISSIFLGNAYIAVAAIGMSMVIISGNIDISVGSLIGVLATIAGTLALNGVPIIICWLAPLVIGIAITSGMGAIVAYLHIPSIVVTLGMLSILKGGLISVTGGAWLTNLPPEFFLSQTRLFGIPTPIYFMVGLTIAAAFWMRLSATGRAIYAVGGNVEAARLSGIDPAATVVKAFAIHGFFVGIAAVLFATQLSVIQSTVPPNLELTIITASVVGGVSILGGTGTVIGSTLAAVLIAAIASSMIFVNISPFWMRAVQGILILVTVLADLWRRQRQRMGT
ncbi:ABC transporter permease [Bauldia litoralis]|uniref:Autoinducer 2 import system permease protein LsrC n=1 Tax=Bauldia litoralis TaxID=665467 RepID=A0A1G6A709_9HYPH|nr:ABC transporter permease [Bauldia litoralis]SDB04237.1 rhamnose transport system permease protein [Bauldia litoralis]